MLFADVHVHLKEAAASPEPGAAGASQESSAATHLTSHHEKGQSNQQL